MTDIRRYSQRQDHLRQQDAKVSQFGEQFVTQRRVDVYVQGQLTPDDLRETVEQINGDALDGASITASKDKSNPDGLATLTSGTNADDSIKVDTNRNLDYAPGDIFEFSGLVRRDSDNSPTNSQVLDWGMMTSEDGLFFRETSDALQCVVRDGSSGSANDRVLSASDSDVVAGNQNLDTSLLEEARIWFIRGSHYGAGKVVFGTRESVHIDPWHPGRTEKIFLTFDATKASLGRLYMRTANLPASVQIDNDPDDSTSPSSSIDVDVGDRQLSIYGSNKANPRTLQQQYSGLTASNGSSDIACVLRPKATFAGIPNGINVTLEAIDITVDGGTAPVRFWTEVGATITSGAFDDSDYSGIESAAEIGLGNAQTDGNVQATEGSGINVQPASVIPVGTTGNAPGVSTQQRSITSLGVQQPAVVWVEGQGGTSTFDLTLKWRESH